MHLRISAFYLTSAPTNSLYDRTMATQTTIGQE